MCCVVLCCVVFREGDNIRVMYKGVCVSVYVTSNNYYARVGCIDKLVRVCDVSLCV